MVGIYIMKMKNSLLKFLKGEINPLLNFLIFLVTFIILFGISFSLTYLNISDKNILILISFLLGIYSLLTVYISFKSILITFKKNEKKWDKILSIIIFILMVSFLIINLYDTIILIYDPNVLLE